LLARLFEDMGGLSFASPLKALTAPAIDLLAVLFGDHAWLLLIAAVTLMFVSLRYLVTTLKSLVIAKVDAIFDVVIFKTALRAFLFGLALTVIVQSSSITTSLVIPLAGAGLLSLAQIFPFTLGANVGTTITAILAALAVGEAEALSVAFAHLVFNVSGIALVLPLPAVRNQILRSAERLALISRRNRWLPMVYIVVMFYLLPVLVIVVLR
jgi:sodium-dependent phosphate cotransporter